MLRQKYVRQIDTLREDLLRLGSMVEHALKRAMHCLQNWDVIVSAQVIHDDKQIDETWRLVEDKVIRLLATQQPILASDLRLMSVVVAIAGELERIGDYANSIARRVRRATRRPAFVPAPDGLNEMANLAQRMLHISLDAFLNQDVELAQTLSEYDKRVDQYETDLRAELLDIAKSDPQRIEGAIDLLDVVHALERTADRATNIGERVIFLETNEIEELNP